MARRDGRGSRRPMRTRATASRPRGQGCHELGAGAPSPGRDGDGVSSGGQGGLVAGELGVLPVPGGSSRLHVSPSRGQATGRERSDVSGRSHDRRRADLMTASGQLHGHLRAVSRGRCHSRSRAQLRLTSKGSLMPDSTQPSDGVITKPSSKSVAQTIDGLRRLMADRGFTVFNVIDHSGVAGRPDAGGDVVLESVHSRWSEAPRSAVSYPPPTLAALPSRNAGTT